MHQEMQLCAVKGRKKKDSTNVGNAGLKYFYRGYFFIEKVQTHCTAHIFFPSKQSLFSWSQCSVVSRVKIRCNTIKRKEMSYYSHLVISKMYEVFALFDL